MDRCALQLAVLHNAAGTEAAYHMHIMDFQGHNNCKVAVKPSRQLFT